MLSLILNPEVFSTFWCAISRIWNTFSMISTLSCSVPFPYFPAHNPFLFELSRLSLLSICFLGVFLKLFSSNTCLAILSSSIVSICPSHLPEESYFCAVDLTFVLLVRVSVSEQNVNIGVAILFHQITFLVSYISSSHRLSLRFLILNTCFT